MAAVLSMTVLGGAAVATAPAYAAGSTVTAMTVTGNKTTITSGQSVSFNAAVTPAKVGSTKITGTVTWTVTGADGTVVPCTTLKPLNSGGKSKCQIGNGVLLGASAPFTVAVAYSGDANFAPANASTSIDVTQGKTRTLLVLSAVPTGGAATTLTATVSDGPATAAISGNVVFTVSSQFHAAGVSVRCAGSLSPASLNNVQPVVSGVATCDLPAGWMTLPKLSKGTPKPSDGWSVTAVYNGNASFMTSFRLKKGTAKS
jgi:hypothetical protein